jgi:hypothetical protein
MFAALINLSCDRPSSLSHFQYEIPEAKAVRHEHKLKEIIPITDIDILWVVDNSGSMLSHQFTVIQNINGFIDGLVQNSSLHWKTGLISTDQNEQPVIGFRPNDVLDYTIPNTANRFKAAVQGLGTLGSGSEMTYAPIVNALTDFPFFLRDDAYLAIILVSDAPEQSRMGTTEFVDFLKSVKGDLSKVRFYGFINPTDWFCPPTDDGFTWVGSKYEELLTRIKGAAYKLCDPMFGSNLANLGADLAKEVTSPRIKLNDRPILSSIKVFRGDKEVPGGSNGFWYFDIDLNSIIFTDLSFAPGGSEVVRVEYKIDDGIVRD